MAPHVKDTAKKSNRSGKPSVGSSSFKSFSTSSSSQGTKSDSQSSKSSTDHVPNISRITNDNLTTEPTTTSRAKSKMPQPRPDPSDVLTCEDRICLPPHLRSSEAKQLIEQIIKETMFTRREISRVLAKRAARDSNGDIIYDRRGDCDFRERSKETWEEIKAIVAEPEHAFNSHYGGFVRKEHKKYAGDTVRLFDLAREDANHRFVLPPGSPPWRALVDFAIDFATNVVCDSSDSE